MKLTLLLLCCCFLGCTATVSNNKEKKVDLQHIQTEEYELFIPHDAQALLILFPCFPCDAAHTKEEAPFLQTLLDQKISVLMLNLNQKIFLKTTEKKSIARMITRILGTHELESDRTFLGGFSSGGNIAMLMTSYLLRTKHWTWPKGVFVVDSPLDLSLLYQNAEHDLQLDVSKAATEEANFLIPYFQTHLGAPYDSLENYEAHSVYTFSTHFYRTLLPLRYIKVRLYAEPALDWQRMNRGREYEHLNAYQLEQTAQALKALGNEQTAFITSENKGYRKNGVRHPHSWSIVDGPDLAKWILQTD